MIVIASLTATIKWLIMTNTDLEEPQMYILPREARFRNIYLSENGYRVVSYWKYKQNTQYCRIT